MHEIWPQILILSCIKGAVYSLIAIGFTLVFGVARVVNLAHGSFYMLGAYFVYILIQYCQLHSFVAMIVSVLLVGCIGAAVDFAIIRPKRHSSFYVTIITLSFALLCQYIILSIIGPQAKNISSFFKSDTIIGGFHIANQRIFVMIVFIAVVTGLITFLKFSRFGKAIVAVSEHYSGAVLMGISPEMVFVFVNGASASMAALAGIMISPFLNLNPMMWVFPLIKAFAVVILGGMGSVYGSVVAAFILGFSEVTVTMLISGQLEDLISLMVIAIMLLIKPSGLFGTPSSR